jgi:hypothetical protein
MKLIEIIAQSRRDFQGKYECEFCGHIDTDESLDSYDDRYYHDSVIPNQKCKKCGESTLSGGGSVTHTDTRYPEGFQI